MVWDGAWGEHRLGPSMAVFAPALTQIPLMSSVCHEPKSGPGEESFIHSFIRQIFIESLICVWHRSTYLGHREINKVPLELPDDWEGVKG